MNNLLSLLENFPELSLIQGNLKSEITYVQSDSRKIKLGDIFCLYDTIKPEDRDTFLSDSLKRGAGTVLISPDTNPESIKGFPNILKSSENLSKIHGRIASYLKDYPSRKLKIIAVTGTNGKTSTTNILFQLLESIGKKVGIIGTISIRYLDKIFDSGYTTPDPSLLQEILSEMAESGIEFVCMEASSHGLKLGRMNGVELIAGIFTNLTPDHLDFHPDMQDYLFSKFKLFELLNISSYSQKIAIIPIDAEGGLEMMNLITELKPNYPVLRFGKNGDYSGSLNELSLTSTKFSFINKDKDFQILKTNLLGDFNYFNVALSLILINELFPEIPFTHWEKKIQELSAIPGRFEIVTGLSQDRIAIVDYAHTPDALENVLKSLKNIPHSQLITVFGCGGDRDRKKRPVMAEIATRYSDFLILTSDNPRTENPESILDELEKGIPKEFTNWIRIVDRREAIRKAVEDLGQNGLLLVAGKGHENYQIIGTQKFPFSDQDEIRIAFTNLEKRYL